MRRFVSLLLVISIFVQTLGMDIFAISSSIKFQSNSEIVEVVDPVNPSIRPNPNPKPEPEPDPEYGILKNQYSFKINRDYNQDINFNFLNNNQEGLIQFEFVSDEAEDLAYGLNENSTLLPSDKNCISGKIHAQDAQKEDYTFSLVAKKDGSVIDNAVVKVHVINPELKLNIEEISKNPVTLSKTYKVTNIGGKPLSDLNVNLESPGGMFLTKNIQHYRLGVNESLEVTVLPDFFYGDELEGNLSFTNSDKKKTYPIKLESDKNMVDLNLNKYMKLSDLLLLSEQNKPTKEFDKEKIKDIFKMNIIKSEFDPKTRAFDFEANMPKLGNMDLKITSDVSKYPNLVEGKPIVEKNGLEYRVLVKVSIPVEDINKILASHGIEQGIPTEPRQTRSVSGDDVEVVADIISNGIDWWNLETSEDTDLSYVLTTISAPKGVLEIFDKGSGLDLLSESSKYTKFSVGLSLISDGNDLYHYYKSDEYTSDQKATYTMLTLANVGVTLAVAGGVVSGPVGAVAGLCFTLAKIYMENKTVEATMEDIFKFTQCINRRKATFRYSPYSRPYVSRGYGNTSIKNIGIVGDTRIQDRTPLIKENFSYTLNGKKQNQYENLINGRNYTKLNVNDLIDIKNADNINVDNIIDQYNTKTDPRSYVIQSDIKVITDIVLGEDDIIINLPTEMSLKDVLKNIEKDYIISSKKPELSVNENSLFISTGETDTYVKDKGFVGKLSKLILNLYNDGLVGADSKVKVTRNNDNKVIYEENKRLEEFTTTEVKLDYTPEFEKEEFTIELDTNAIEKNIENNKATVIVNNIVDPGRGPDIRILPEDGMKYNYNFNSIETEVSEYNRVPVESVSVYLNENPIESKEVYKGEGRYKATDFNLKEGENTIKVVAKDSFGNISERESKVTVKTIPDLKEKFTDDGILEISPKEAFSLKDVRDINHFVFNFDEGYYGDSVVDSIKSIESKDSEILEVKDDVLIGKKPGETELVVKANYSTGNASKEIERTIKVKVKEDVTDYYLISGEIVEEFIENGCNPSNIYIINGDASTVSYRSFNGQQVDHFTYYNNKIHLRIFNSNYTNPTLVIINGEDYVKVPLDKKDIKIDKVERKECTINFNSNSNYKVESVYAYNTDSNIIKEGNSNSIVLKEGNYNFTIRGKINGYPHTYYLYNQKIDESKSIKLEDIDIGTINLKIPEGTKIVRFEINNGLDYLSLKPEEGTNNYSVPVGSYEYANLILDDGSKIYSIGISNFKVTKGGSTNLTIDDTFNCTIRALSTTVTTNSQMAFDISGEDKYGNRIYSGFTSYWTNIETGELYETPVEYRGGRYLATSPSKPGKYRVSLSGYITIAPLNFSSHKSTNTISKEDIIKYVFTINDTKYKIIVGTREVTMDMDVAPIISKDRTMMPIRKVAELIGAEVKWDEATRTATFSKNKINAAIQIDGNIIELGNNDKIEMDSKPININNRILISLTNISKIFDLTNGNVDDGVDQDIEWNGKDNTVTIIRKLNK